MPSLVRVQLAWLADELDQHPSVKYEVLTWLHLAARQAGQNLETWPATGGAGYGYSIRVGDAEIVPLVAPLHGGRCEAQHQEGGRSGVDALGMPWYAGGRWVQCKLPPDHSGAHEWGTDNQVTPAAPAP